MADANLGEARQFDYDTGGGTDLVEVSGIVFPASGAAVAAGGFLETGTNAVGALAVGGGTPHDSVDSGYPLKIGGRGQATVPTSVSTDGDRVNAWFLLNGAQATVITAAGALIGGDASNGLDVDVTRLPALVAGSANIGDVDVLTVPADPFGVNADAASATGSISAKLRLQATTALVGDAAATATPTGTMQIGLAKAAAPTDVSADNDAVAMWMLRNGSQVVNLAAGGTLLTNTGQAAASANFGKITDGTLTVGAVDETGASAVDALAVGGGTPHDSVDSGNPVKIGGVANTSAPAAVASGDRVNARFLTTGALTVHVVDAAGAAASMGGGTQYVEDVAFGGNGTGTLMVARRDDALATLTPVEDDAIGLRVNNRGALWVSIVDTAGAQATLGTQYVGDAAATATPTGTIVMGLANAAAPTGVSADNDAVAAWHLRNGAQVSALTGGAGLLVAAATSADNIALGIGLNVNAVNLGYDGTNTDLLRTIPALDAAPNVDTGILAIGAGPGWDRKTNPTGVAATSTANAVTVVTDGADLMQFHVTTIGTTPGSMIFETTGDDSNWAVAGFVLRLSAGPDVRIEGLFVPAVNDVYMVRTTGVRQVRYRVNAVYASGTATVKVTSSLGVGLIKGIDMPPPPHNIGYALVGVAAQYTSAQTSTTIGPTVASTQRLVVTYLQIQAGGTVAATQCSVYFGTGAYSRGTSKTIFDGEFAPSATLKPGVVIAPPVPFTGAADEELKITSVGAANPLTVTIWYYLVTA